MLPSCQKLYSSSLLPVHWWLSNSISLLLRLDEPHAASEIYNISLYTAVELSMHGSSVRLLMYRHCHDDTMQTEKHVHITRRQRMSTLRAFEGHNKRCAAHGIWIMQGLCLNVYQVLRTWYTAVAYCCTVGYCCTGSVIPTYELAIRPQNEKASASPPWSFCHNQRP